MVILPASPQRSSLVERVSTRVIHRIFRRQRLTPALARLWSVALADDAQPQRRAAYSRGGESS